jgi:hypothetical protein
MERPVVISLLLIWAMTVRAQISFYNMPNPDMLPDVGYSYVEYDRYQSLKKEKTVNASVFRASVQPIKFWEIGANFWFNDDSPADPNRVVISNKFKVELLSKGHFNITMSPGAWTSFYYDGTPMKNLVYSFIGINHEEHRKAYTRLMIGGYGKYQKEKSSVYGLIAGLEHRFNDYIEFVTDYFQGSGEGFGLATGIVVYAAQKGHNLPIYLAYQFDNDSRKNDLFLFQIGYFLRAWNRKSDPASGRQMSNFQLRNSIR